MTEKLISRYIVVDPAICHGKPTFRGTRIMVFQVLEMVARGMDWAEITDAWDGKVTREAIAETMRLSGQAFLEHIEEYVVETAPV